MSRDHEIQRRIALQLLAAVARGDRPTTLVWLGVALVVSGNVVVARSAATDRSATTDALPDRSASTPRSAVACALLAACGFGVTVPLLDLAGRDVGRLWVIPTVWLVELALGVPLLLALGLLNRPRADDARALGLAAVFEVGGFIALSIGLSVASVSVC